MKETEGSPSISTKLARIAKNAKDHPDVQWTALAYHMDVEWLREAYRLTRKNGAPGVDGQTAEEYSQDLDARLRTLLDRAKSGMYRAPAVRRVYIPKADGSQRPIGIPTFEDKVLQRAAVMVLEAVYEQEFLDCSYGFRPGRSAHQALQELWHQTMAMGGCWMVELDIRKFFDTLDHARLREVFQKRIRDGVLVRLIGKWLNAGVMEDGAIRATTTGTPQGGVISPLLANVYLHEVLDTWFERDVRPRLKGRAFLIRYADDAVLGFEHEDDARRVLDVLPKRFEKYGLTLHPEKTKLVQFRRPPKNARDDNDQPKPPQPGSFDLLGFRHFWGRSRDGRWVVRRKTAPSRFQRAVRTTWDWCRTHRHLPVPQQAVQLNRKLVGHYAYYGITGNYVRLADFRDKVRHAWKYWLGRRSQRGRFGEAEFERLLCRHPLRLARVVHTVM
jgi:RNA-directed DNA polymerase